MSIFQQPAKVVPTDHNPQNSPVIQEILLSLPASDIWLTWCVVCGGVTHFSRVGRSFCEWCLTELTRTRAGQLFTLDHWNHPYAAEEAEAARNQPDQAE